MLLWCRHCAKGIDIPKRLPRCPMCNALWPGWSEHCPVPRRPWELRRKDWAFLKALVVNPEIDRPDW